MKKENQIIIRCLNKYGKVPETYELLEKIDLLEEENQRLNNVLNELRENAIAFINIFQDEKTLTLNYNDLKHLRGIINGEEFDIRILKDKLQELKESDK